MLKIKNISKSYRNNKQIINVFKGFNLEINENEFVSIWGPNSCGKTSLLNIIAGITAHDSGEIKFKNKPASGCKISYAFQDYRNSLFPWLKVKDNISFPLKLRGMDKKTRYNEVIKICKKFGRNFSLESFPYELSGGQQQFASLLRGLIINPEIYLLDEPFSSLDYQTTLSMLEKLAGIWQKAKTTTLFVSHEIDDAIFLSQRIILLSDKPTKIKKIIDNPLPYPRRINLLGSRKFAEIKNKILSLYKFNKER